MANQNSQTANPNQQQQQQPNVTQHLHQHEHHNKDNSWGWGALLMAGCVGFFLGQVTANTNTAPAQPPAPKHFWQ